MDHVAFVTYNRVGDDLSSGWHDGPEGRRALLVQNSKGVDWAVKYVFQDGIRPDDYRRSDDQYADPVRGEISNLWGQLQTALPELDHVVVYVGSKGSERAIALAAQLPASKVTFVGCDCGLPVKEAMIQAAGMAQAGRMLCECGGHRTMKQLYQLFMETGELRASA